MACSADKCMVRKEGERQISCWLCENLFHIKCVGLLPRTTDQLMDSSLGLRWCCPKCRATDIEFYRFFKETKGEFSEIFSEFESLLAKFHRFRELFSKFGKLDKLLKLRNDPAPVSPEIIEIVKPVDEPNIPTSMATSTKVAPVVNSTNVPGCTTKLSLVKSPNLIELGEKSPIPPPNDIAPPTSLMPSSSNRASVRTNAPVIAPRSLVVVRPRRTIFISRLACDTSVEDISYYVKSKISVPFEFNCVKMKSSLNRTISSFKLYVSDDKFDEIVNPMFWPQGMIVREFVFKENRRKNVVTLPTSAPQKN